MPISDNVLVTSQFYDDGIFYDAATFYDGYVVPLSNGGGSSSAREAKRKKLEYCKLSVDFDHCMVNEEFVLCEFKEVRFECEEDPDDAPNITIQSINVTDTSSDDCWFEVLDYAINSKRKDAYLDEVKIKVAKVMVKKRKVNPTLKPQTVTKPTAKKDSS